MSRPEAPNEAPPAAAGPTDAPPAAKPPGVPGPQGSRYGWFVGVVALLIIALITVNTITTKSNGSTGVAVGRPMPPFAVPLGPSSLNGDADVATRAHEGSLGGRPACSVRGPRILNVCALYERGPVVLALFVVGGSCPVVVDDMQRLSGSFPGVQFAAVAIRGDRAHLRSVIRTHGWTLPVGYDHDGEVANLYKVSTCPQVTFAYPGGAVAQKALLGRPGASLLRQRVTELVAAARARGWRPPG